MEVIEKNDLMETILELSRKAKYTKRLYSIIDLINRGVLGVCMEVLRPGSGAHREHFVHNQFRNVGCCRPTQNRSPGIAANFNNF